jgi:hypothetical protein
LAGKQGGDAERTVDAFSHWRLVAINLTATGDEGRNVQNHPIGMPTSLSAMREIDCPPGFIATAELEGAWQRSVINTRITAMSISGTSRTSRLFGRPVGAR